MGEEISDKNNGDREMEEKKFQTKTMVTVNWKRRKKNFREKQWSP